MLLRSGVVSGLIATQKVQHAQSYPKSLASVVLGLDPNGRAYGSYQTRAETDYNPDVHDVPSIGLFDDATVLSCLASRALTPSDKTRLPCPTSTISCGSMENRLGLLQRWR